MSTTVQNYTFYNVDRIEDDASCETQRTMQNTRYANYTTSNYFSEFPSDTQIQFATSQPAIMPNGTFGGSGVGAANIETESILTLNTEQERSLGRLSLLQRPFTTVPFLGRGSCDPSLESRLMQGETVTDKKSVSTVMSQSFMGFTLYPTSSKMEDQVKNTKNTVEESAMDGWIRGGAATRDMAKDPSLSQNNRPANGSF